MQAASFAYSSTAFPRLAGTLVTIAGFVPIGFARSAAGEYTFSIFAVVAIALIAIVVRRGPVYAHARRLGAQEAQDGASSRRRTEPGPIMRAFRSFLVLAMRAPLGHDRCDARPVRGGALWHALRSAAVLPVVRPARAAGRPAAARKRVHLRNTGRLGPSGQAPEGRSGRRSLEHLCRAGRRPVLSAPERAAPERLFRPGRRRHQGTRAARTREGEARAGAGDRVPERCRAGLPAGARPAGRMAAPIPGERAGAGRGAQDRLRGGRASRLGPRRRERQLQLDGARPHHQDPGRPGSGPTPRPQLAGIGSGGERGRVRRHGDPDAQRDLARRRAGPGLRRTAQVAVGDPDASGAAAERENRSVEPDRLGRVRPGISHRLASGPAADRDGAGRPRAGHAGRDRRAGARAEDRGAECQPADRISCQRRRKRGGERQGAGLGRSPSCL